MCLGEKKSKLRFLDFTVLCFLFCVYHLPQQWEGSYNGWKNAVLVEWDCGKIVDFQAICHVPQASTVAVSMGHYHNPVAPLNQALGKLQNTDVVSSVTF